MLNFSGFPPATRRHAQPAARASTSRAAGRDGSGRARRRSAGSPANSTGTQVAVAPPRGAWIARRRRSPTIVAPRAAAIGLTRGEHRRRTGGSSARVRQRQPSAIASSPVCYSPLLILQASRRTPARRGCSTKRHRSALVQLREQAVHLLRALRLRGLAAVDDRRGSRRPAERCRARSR